MGFISRMACVRVWYTSIFMFAVLRLVQGIEREVIVTKLGSFKLTSEEGVSPIYRTWLVFKVKTPGTAVVVLSDIVSISNTYGSYFMVYIGMNVFVRESCFSCQPKKKAPITLDRTKHTTFWLRWNNRGMFRLGRGAKLGEDVLLKYTSEKAFPIYFTQVTALNSKSPTSFKFDIQPLESIGAVDPASDSVREITVTKKGAFELTSEIGVSPLYRDSIVFQLKSCRAGIVALSDILGISNSQGRYMIAYIGKQTNNGQEVSIHDSCYSCPANKTASTTYDCNTYTTFWLSWNNRGRFRLGKGSELENDVIVEYESNKGFPVRFMQIAALQPPASFRFMPRTDIRNSTLALSTQLAPSITMSQIADAATSSTTIITTSTSSDYSDTTSTTTTTTTNAAATSSTTTTTTAIYTAVVTATETATATATPDTDIATYTDTTKRASSSSASLEPRHSFTNTTTTPFTTVRINTNTKPETTSLSISTSRISSINITYTTRPTVRTSRTTLTTPTATSFTTASVTTTATTTTASKAPPKSNGIRALPSTLRIVQYPMMTDALLTPQLRCGL